MIRAIAVTACWCGVAGIDTVAGVAFSYHRVHPSELTSSEVDRWRELQQSNDALKSPFFCPEFSLLVAEQRSDAAVTVIEWEGRICAFFPYQAGRLGLGKPLGGILSDHHGVIAGPGTVVDVPKMLRASGLRRWTFGELATTQPGLHRFSTSAVSSPIIDLADGFEAYLEQREPHTDFFRQTRTRLRRLERKVGPVRFEPRTTSKETLDQLRTWKSAKYLASGFADLFIEPWAVGLTDRVMTTEAPGFTGMLSALFADDRLIAAHLGMASTAVWHWWLPSYSVDYSPFSPGSILLAMVTEHAPRIGVRQIDLGTGPDPYKDRVANSSVEVVAGTVEPTAAHRQVGRLADAGIDALRRSETVRSVARRARHVVERLR